MEINYTSKDIYISSIRPFIPPFVKYIYRYLFFHKKENKDSAMANIIYQFVMKHKNEIPYFTNKKIKEWGGDYLTKYIFTKQILDKSL